MSRPAALAIKGLPHVPKKSEDAVFMTRAEAAEYLRVSERTIDRMIKDAEFRTKKVRGRRLIYKVSLDAFVETSSD